MSTGWALVNGVVLGLGCASSLALGWWLRGVDERNRQRPSKCRECRAMGRNCSLHVGRSRD